MEMKPYLGLLDMALPRFPLCMHSWLLKVLGTKKEKVSQNDKIGINISVISDLIIFSSLSNFLIQ